MNTRTPLLLALAAVIVTSCGTVTSDSTGSTTTELVATSTGVTTSTGVVSTATPTTTDPPPPATSPTLRPSTTSTTSTTEPMSTATFANTATTTVAPQAIVLTANGIGPAMFGETSTDDFIALMQPALGPVTGALSGPRYVPDGDTYIATEGPPLRFEYPFHKILCFEEWLCAYFGGPFDPEVVMVGYRLSSDQGSVVTESGVRIGSLLSELGDSVAITGDGCESTVNATMDGLRLVIELQPDSSAADPDGIVVQIRAGSLPTPDDC